MVCHPERANGTERSAVEEVMNRMLADSVLVDEAVEAVVRVKPVPERGPGRSKSCW
jgi:actin-like ATPase involved in cell morphogenesis